MACPLHKAGDDWRCDMAHLEALLARPQTKILLLCSPHNPTGKVWRRDELQQMAELCERHDVRVISDEIHMDMVWGTPPYAVELVATGGWAPLTSGSKSFNIPALTGAYGFISDDASREAYFQQLKARDGSPRRRCWRSPRTWPPIATANPRWIPLRDYLQDNLTYVAERLNRRFRRWAGARRRPPTASIDLRPLAVDDRALQQALIERGGDHAGLYLRRGRPRVPALNVGCPRSKLEAGMDKLIAGLRLVLGEHSARASLRPPLDYP